MLKTPMSDLEYPFVVRLHLRSVFRILSVLSLFGFLTAPAPVVAVTSISGLDGNDMTAALLIVVLGAVALGALVITGLVLWSNKQEHMRDMMLFCMKYLVHSKDETERCNSAMALRRVRDPGALLVLVDVIWDEEETEAVRRAASEALHDMGAHFSKHRKIIADLELGVEQRNFARIIEILTANFENGKTKYVQNAYVIGRNYMRLERYSDARDWFRRAESRNRKFNLYGNRIRYWIEVCNTRLLEEADGSFKEADYQQARAHYAALALGLSDADGQRCAVYLRSACVYCKLRDYLDADQALLQALEHNHELDLALTLVPMLQEILSLSDQKVEPNDQLEELKNAIDERASSIMSALSAQKSPKKRLNGLKNSVSDF